MSFYVFKCRKCSTWGAGQTGNISNYIYRCDHCGESRRIHLKNTLGHMIPVNGPYRTAQIAAAVVQELNKEESCSFVVPRQETPGVASAISGAHYSEFSSYRIRNDGKKILETFAYRVPAGIIITIRDLLFFGKPCNGKAISKAMGLDYALISR
jgi:hypothetical protein